MNKQKVLRIVLCSVLLVGAYAAIAVVVTVTTKAEVGTTNKAEVSASEDTVKNDGASSSSGKKAAEKLIDQTLSREEIEVAVGECEDFEMSSAGCERGVYSGKFFYKDFTIHSRTYDKGKTFHIVSEN